MKKYYLSSFIFCEKKKFFIITKRIFFYGKNHVVREHFTILYEPLLIFKFFIKSIIFYYYFSLSFRVAKFKEPFELYKYVCPKRQKTIFFYPKKQKTIQQLSKSSKDTIAFASMAISPLRRPQQQVVVVVVVVHETKSEHVQPTTH